ncbi:hypothetical protein [Novipirellula caenicola]|uniref:Uncharacterized protein n=1 Tax=Novipirellula caenicola TaxID=1536901 RepID=A0ABP9W198_9BACT
MHQGNTSQQQSDIVSHEKSGDLPSSSSGSEKLGRERAEGPVVSKMDEGNVEDPPARPSLPLWGAGFALKRP